MDEIELRQALRSDELGRQRIANRHRRLRGADGKQHAQHGDPFVRHMRYQEHVNDGRGEQRRQRKQAQQVGEQGSELAGMRRRALGVNRAVALFFELFKPAINQVISHVRRALRVIGFAQGQLDGVARHIGLNAFRALGDFVDNLPVRVARFEIHQRVDARRIFAQHLFHRAVTFDEFAPVGGGQLAQTGDRISDRHLVGRLPLAFGENHLLDRKPLFGEMLIEPTERQSQRGILPLQVAAQFGDERATGRQFGFQHVGQNQHQILGIARGHRDQFIRPVGGQIAIGMCEPDALRDAAQVFDQRQAQHDRHRPQFADRQAHRVLVAVDKAAQISDVYAPVDVRNQFRRQMINARQAVRGAGGQDRQFAAEAPRQMLAGQANVFFNDVIVVQQPLRSRGHARFFAHHLGHQLVRLINDLFILLQSRQQQLFAATE